MRSLGSIFVGLAAFAAVTTAFLLALTLMVSGPPTWSEMRGLSDVSETAMRDLGAIGRRVAGLLERPEAAAPVAETIASAPVAPRAKEKAAPPRRIAKLEPERAEPRRREQKRRAEKARRPQREARIAPPRRAEATPLESNPVWLTRELERGEAPSTPRIEPDEEPAPLPEEPIQEDEAPADEGAVYEGDGRSSADAYYEELEREAYEREAYERELAERAYYRWRWR